MSATRPLHVAVSGASGLVGSSVCRMLAGSGHRIGRLVRRETTSDDEIRWDPARGSIERDKLAAFDAVVHLAGENLMGRWTPAKKRRIRDSRVLVNASTDNKIKLRFGSDNGYYVSG